MSFLKITDSKKRDQIVAEYLKTKRNIQNQQLSERMGEQEVLTGLIKQFKPITDTQKQLTQNILSEVKPIKDLLQNLPNVITYPQLPALTYQDEESEKDTTLGNIAVKYLQEYMTEDADRTFGINKKNNKFYIGDTRITVIDNNIKIGDKEYKGTPGL